MQVRRALIQVVMGGVSMTMVLLMIMMLVVIIVTVTMAGPASLS